MDDETEIDEMGPLEAEAELSGRQEALIAALLSEPTQEAAALKAEVFVHAMARLQGATGDALDTLRDVMTDTANPAAARVTAARTVLDFARQHIETAELEERLAALESLAGVRR